MPTGILGACSISLRTRLTASIAPESSTRETIPNGPGLTRRLAIAWKTKTASWETSDYPPQTHGQRLNNEAYAQQQLIVGRFDLIAGARFIHNSAFGNTGVPRVAVAWQALRGAERFSGTRLRFSYATGFKEPRLEETFAGPPYTRANTALKPERSRSFEAGLQQNFLQGRYVFTTTYFNNLFQDQINYLTVDPVSFIGEYSNVNRALAHGVEAELQAKLRSRLLLNAAYTYTSTQILVNPAPINALYNPGQPLLAAPNIPPLFCCPISDRGGEEMSPEVLWDAARLRLSGFQHRSRGGIRSCRCRRMVCDSSAANRVRQCRERPGSPLQRSGGLPRAAHQLPCRLPRPSGRRVR